MKNKDYIWRTKNNYKNRGLLLKDCIFYILEIDNIQFSFYFKNSSNFETHEIVCNFYGDYDLIKIMKKSFKNNTEIIGDIRLDKYTHKQLLYESVLHGELLNIKKII